VNISASSDYAVRALLYIAQKSQNRSLSKKKSGGMRVSTLEIADSEEISMKYLETILRKLRQAGLIDSHRGPGGGHELSRSASEISIADVIRAIDGPLAAVRGERPESVDYSGQAKHLKKVWIAVRSSLRDILEEVSLAQVLSGNFPARVAKALSEPGAWSRR
jgi:Rrf2 family protein